MATLVGLDFGSTTSSCLVASADVRRNAATGRMELADVHERFRSPLTFTPLVGERLDLPALEAAVDGWLAAARVDPGDVLGGGALVTGLTARRDNAPALTTAVRRRLGAGVVAVADDPCLESWLAFQGSAAALSRRHSDRWFLHLDIGGGTTNLALGRDGAVWATACLFVGARHVRLDPDTTTVAGTSRLGARLLDNLRLPTAAGGRLGGAGLDRLAARTLTLLERFIDAAASTGDHPTDDLDRAHVQVPFPADLPAGCLESASVTLSGGVGELVYDLAAGRAIPGPGGFGDIGTALARALAAAPRWRRHWSEAVPDGGGRATCLGLMRHSTRVSGASLHGVDAKLLPLADLPIVGRLGPTADERSIRAVLALAARAALGAGVSVTGCLTAADVTTLGTRVASILAATAYPCDRPLVFLLDADAGKAFGQVATGWGRLPVRVLAIDELDLPDARFVSLGAVRGGVVPVTFHGLRS